MSELEEARKLDDYGKFLSIFFLNIYNVNIFQVSRKIVLVFQILSSIEKVKTLPKG